MSRLAVIAAALGLLLAAGCGRPDRAGVQEQVRGVRETLDRAAENAQRAAADAALEGTVKAALTSRKALAGAKIDVEARGGHLVLKGDVASPEQARIAEEVARETSGVRSVQNRLTMRVPATSPSTSLFTPPPGVGPQPAEPPANAAPAPEDARPQPEGPSRGPNP